MTVDHPGAPAADAAIALVATASFDGPEGRIEDGQRFTVKDPERATWLRSRHLARTDRDAD